MRLNQKLMDTRNDLRAAISLHKLMRPVQRLSLAAAFGLAIVLLFMLAMQRCTRPMGDPQAPGIPPAPRIGQMESGR